MSDVGGIAGDQLRSFIERIERLEEEKKGISDDIRDIYAEAKGTGFDVKIIRQIIKIRKMENNERQEQEELLDLYMAALGMAE
ncbi:MAG TPA: GapR family DNA-binding domain-containing protein [Azospirillaceae bacterium]|nr:GapR family DNA-binding domain-containing protein [Azospirillaceae bacterium]